MRKSPPIEIQETVITRNRGDANWCVKATDTTEITRLRKAGYEPIDAPDAAELHAWLNSLPLIHRAPGFLLVHAGISPWWSWDDAVARAGLSGQV